jgi:hypothetical protein
MASLASMNGLSSRRLLALLALVGQVFGSVGGLVPVRANSAKNTSGIAYPCQDHPCGCESAEKCWSAPCCCFTMREKVAWAQDHGVNPPKHALRLAAEEEREVRLAEPHEPAKLDCCSHHSTTSCDHTQEITAHSSKASSMKLASNRLGWIAGLFAKKCQGPGYSDLGILNIGFPPTVPGTWICEIKLVETQVLRNQTPVAATYEPSIPPPKC